MITLTIQASSDAITEDALDPALFVALFLGVVGTVYAMGEPLTKGEMRLRMGTLIICAVIALIMAFWLVTGIMRRAGWL